MTDSDSPTAEAQAPLDQMPDAFARAIVETVRTPLLVLDSQRRIISANPSFHATFNLPTEEVLGHVLFDVGQGQWDLEALREILEGALSEKDRVRDIQLEANLQGLGRRILVIDARQVRLEGDRHPLVLLSIEDVTERERYERRIEAYAKELERSNRDLESFAHAASHDLQEPLRKVRTYAARLVDSVDASTLDDRTRRYLERMPEAVERMQTRIDDLLLLARVGRSEIEREPTDLTEVVQGVLEDLDLRIAEVGAEVEVEELPEVLADAALMRLLFQNLISNGLKFAREGSPPAIRIRSEAAGPDAEGPASARILVEDEGIGFEQQYAERIFGPFQRLHGRTAYEGSGVGLAICRRIVVRHGGSITAEGRPDQGARFVITLPVHSTGEELDDR